jgi:hypothetical protein
MFFSRVHWNKLKEKGKYPLAREMHFFSRAFEALGVNQRCSSKFFSKKNVYGKKCKRPVIIQHKNPMMEAYHQRDISVTSVCDISSWTLPHQRRYIFSGESGDRQDNRPVSESGDGCRPGSGSSLSR